MFVLTNAWSEMRRHPWRTALLIIVSLLVTMWSVFGAAVMHEYNTAHTETYNQLQPQATIRMTNTAQADRNGDNADWTKRYLSWDAYNTLVSPLQAQGIKFSYSAIASVPVRQSDTLKAIRTSSTSDASENETGGNLTLTSFLNDSAAIANEYGSFTITDGNNLAYQDTKARNALISEQLAQANNLKVGDSITVGNPTDASKTYTYTVGGIYKYTSDPAGVEGDNATFAKDNRNNVIYTSYYNFASDGLDTTDGTGWSIPNLNVVFTLANPSTYEQFKAAIASGLPEGYAIESPTITTYLDSLAPLDALANTTRVMLICVWIAGGLLILGLALLEILPRTNEIGFALATGVTKARLGWQFMVEIFIQTLLGIALGLVIGGCASNPLATSMAQGHTIGMQASLLWHVTWIALLLSLALAIIAALRVAFFRTHQLVKSPYLSTNSPVMESTTSSADTDANNQNHDDLTNHEEQQ